MLVFQQFMNIFFLWQIKTLNWSGKILIVPHFYLYVLGYKSTAAIKYSTLIFFHGKPWSYRPPCQQPESTKLHKQILSKTSTYLLLTINKRKNARKYCYLVHDFMLYLYRNIGVFIQLMQRAEMWRIGF